MLRRLVLFGSLVWGVVETMAPTSWARQPETRLPMAWSSSLCPMSPVVSGGTDAGDHGRVVARGGRPTRISARALRRYWRLHGFDIERLERARPAPVRMVQNGRDCLAELRRLGVGFKPGPKVRGVAWPVILDDRVGGLKIHSVYGRPRLMDCRMALALYQAAPLILAAGFDTMHFWGFYSYRNVAHTHHLSRHAFGLAVDVPIFSGPGGRVVVDRDWVHADGGPRDCIGPVHSVAAARLRGLICRIEAARIFRRILTPDTNYAHRDHIHFSAPKYGEHWVRRSWAGRRLGRSWKRGRRNWRRGRSGFGKIRSGRSGRRGRWGRGRRHTRRKSAGRKVSSGRPRSRKTLRGGTARGRRRTSHRSRRKGRGRSRGRRSRRAAAHRRSR